MSDLLCKAIIVVDLKLLKKQKQWLLDQKPYTSGAEGLLGLIDAIQDYAVDQCGIPEEAVFDFIRE